MIVHRNVEATVSKIAGDGKHNLAMGLWGPL